MALVHRETVAEQGVEAVLLDVGENHVELLAPLGRGHAGRALPGQARARACTTSPTRSTTSRPTLAALRAAGVRLIDEAPRTGIRGSRVAFLHPAASGGVLTEIVQPAEGHVTDPTPSPSRRASASRAARCCPCASPRTSSTSCARRCRTAASGWLRGRGRPTAPCSSTSAGRLPARRVRRAPRRLLSRSLHHALRRSANAARPRRSTGASARSAHTPEPCALGAPLLAARRARRGVARAGRRGGALVDRRRRRRWLRATATSAAAYAHLDRRSSSRSAAARPVVEDLPHLMATPDRPVASRRRTPTSSFAAARAYGALLPAGAAVRARPSRWPSRASTSACTTRPTSPPARRSAPCSGARPR